MLACPLLCLRFVSFHQTVITQVTFVPLNFFHKLSLPYCSPSHLYACSLGNFLISSLTKSSSRSGDHQNDFSFYCCYQVSSCKGPAWIGCCWLLRWPGMFGIYHPLCPCCFPDALRVSSLFGRMFVYCFWASLTF